MSVFKPASTRKGTHALNMCRTHTLSLLHTRTHTHSRSHMCSAHRWNRKPGNPIWKGRLSTVHLLIKVDSFVEKIINVFSFKMSWYKLVSTRRPTVLSLPVQQGFPAQAEAGESAAPNRREPKTRSDRVFNFKLGRFGSKNVNFYVIPRPLPLLTALPRFVPLAATFTPM